MFTKIKTKEGKELNFVTQQYETGLYIIVNNNPALQGSSLLKEEAYHKQLRIKAIKIGDTLLDGTIIPYKGKKYNINNFIKE